jgi:hypothetical protein
MTKRFTAVGLLTALVVGGVVGAWAWDQFEDDTQTPHGGTPRISPNADLLDVVRVVESLAEVRPCRMVEMYRHKPLTVRAFCSTTIGDQLRIAHHNDASAQDDDVTGFCIVGGGQVAFIPSGARWSLYQVAEGNPDGPDPELTAKLTNVLGVETATCT